MSATLLRRLDMSETTRHTFHATITAQYGRDLANLIFGKVKEPALVAPSTESRQIYLPFGTEDREYSIEHQVCVQCETYLGDDEILSSTFLHKGQLSFYMCDCCQRDAFFSSEPKKEPVKLTHKRDED